MNTAPRLSIYQQDMPPRVFTPNPAAQTLAEALWLSHELTPLPLCSGLGRCGACKVRFMHAAPEPLSVELEVLGQGAIAHGWRLACRHSLAQLFAKNPSLALELPPAQRKAAKNDVFVPLAHTDAPYLAMDLGTTSLCWQALDSTGKILTEGSLLNPQMGAGADVISRLRFSVQEGGQTLLAQKITAALQDILQQISAPVQQIGLAANTAMTSIFLGKELEGLAHAPYALPYTGHSIEHIEGLPPLYIPPTLGPFVGGDISAGYAALMARKKRGEPIAYPFLLADLGTNGEFILALDADTALVTSVPMGPALEGIGLSHGHMADGSAGIVDAVQLGPTGLVPHVIDHVIDGAVNGITDGAIPQAMYEKICGTGYISLIHTLRKAGLLSQEGLFEQSPQGKSPLLAKLLTTLVKTPSGMALGLWPKLSRTPVFLHAADVEEVLKVKAAFSLAMAYLLRHANLKSTQLQHIYLAGAMGKYVQVRDLEGLGFVPSGMGQRIQSLGNSSLEGMGQLLLNTDLRQEIYHWSQSSTLVALTEDEHFTENFMQHMNFSFIG